MRAAILSAFTVFSLAIAPADAGGKGYSVTADEPYGDLPKQVLDIYTPEGATDDTPVLVLIHGGGFSGGSKSQVREVGKSLAEAGSIVVTPKYRLNVPFPTFVEDAAKVVVYVQDNLRTADGEPRPLVVSGWSAGAYIGAMLAYDGRYIAAEGGPPDAIAGFIGLAGPYWGGLCAGARCPNTFPSETEADWPVADFVDPGDPPMLLVWGNRDNSVDRVNIDDLAAAGREAGLEVEALILEDKFHSQVLYMLGDAGTEVRTAADAFMSKVTSD